MKNVVASIRARLLNEARTNQKEFGPVLERYAIGRLIYRLSVSNYADQFILKGAQLFSIWTTEGFRPTRDADFLGLSEYDEKELETTFKEICSLSIQEEDGLIWHDVSAQAIRKDNRHGGIRIRLIATLEQARIRVQIDVGFGDCVTPEPVQIQWMGMLGFKPCAILAYPPETVIAEKIEAAVALGDGNSRMKDFYDLYWMSKHMSFGRNLLVEAIKSTFSRRKTAFPMETPSSFCVSFANRLDKQTQWVAFLRKSHLSSLEFSEVLDEINHFLTPLFQKNETSHPDQSWHPDEGWKNAQ
jgi:hypothetical protein